jgi:hypothetical protein
MSLIKAQRFLGWGIVVPVKSSSFGTDRVRVKKNDDFLLLLLLLSFFVINDNDWNGSLKDIVFETITAITGDRFPVLILLLLGWDGCFTHFFVPYAIKTPTGEFMHIPLLVGGLHHLVLDAVPALARG